MEYFALATIVAAVISFTVGTIFDINIGLLCIVTGFVASIACGGDGTEIIAAVSSNTFVLMVGILFMFTIANKNGTIGKICFILLKLVRGNRILMPFTFALVGGFVCGLGAGGIATSALLCGPAAGMAKKTKIDPMLMATTTMHGIFAGQFTPISALAIPILAYLAQAGYPGLGGKIMGWNIAIELLMTVFAFMVFGGRSMLKNSGDVFSIDLEDEKATKFDIQNWITVSCILLLIVSILTVKFNVGVVSLTLGIIMLMFGKKRGMKDTDIIKAVPWNSVVMIIGAMALMTVMGDAGGTALIVSVIHSLDIGVFGLLLLIAAAGLMSFYATSVPIILAVLPLAIELCKTMGVPQMIPGMVIAICISATIVDVSPVSNNGAMFLASAVAGNEAQTQRMFRKLFAYGASQIVIGSIICWLLFVILGI